MKSVLFENAHVFDGRSAERLVNHNVFVENGIIREVSDTKINVGADRTVDVGGRTLMPGLIDLHIHAYGSDMNVHRIDAAGAPYRTAYAVRMLEHALDCGFTSVRDVGGGDWSLWCAVEHGLIRAPRFFYAGKILSMTGGHGDTRHIGESQHSQGYCSCGASNSLCTIADGVDACVRAAREELRRGAHCIKIMGSGGILSPTDPIWMNQYREDEVRAIVNECRERRTYVSAHCHPAGAIRRAIEFGVRCIEHGTLIDEETALFAAEHATYVVPTIVILYALVELGERSGVAPHIQEKAVEVQRRALHGLEIMQRANLKVGFGSDLMGDTHTQQCREFVIRREVFSPVEILRQATSTAAEILMQDGKLGCIAAGAHADLIIVDGNPLEDISLLARDGAALSMIMRAGSFHKLRN